MAYEYFMELHRKTAIGKVSRDKTFNFAKNPKYDGYQRGISSMVSKFYDEKSSDGVVTNVKNEKYTHLLKKYLEC